MDSATRPIPLSEWEHWKDTILELTRHNTLKKVIAIMRDNHDFNASRSQYEARLRAWECRKNLSKEEWATVFETVEKLKSQHQDKSKTNIQQGEIQTSELQNKKGRSGGLRNVSIEILGTGRRWSPCATLEEVNQLNNSSNQVRSCVPPPTSAAISGDALSYPGPGVYEMLHAQVYDGINSFDMESTLEDLDLSHISSSENFDMDIIGERYPVCPEVCQLGPSRAMIPFSVGSTNSVSPGWDSPEWAQLTSKLFSPLPVAFLDRTSYLMNDLPFENFIRDLEIQGISLIKRDSNYPAIHVPLQNPIKIFLADINSCFPKDHTNQSDHGLLDTASIVSSLNGLLPSIQGNCDNGQSLGTEDEMLRAKLIQILLFSAANAFAGLQEIPIQGVFKYLSRYTDINMLSHASHSHVGKAMAENLFRAAIEAKDKSALRCLLALGSIDVNSILCTVGGRKYTPLGRAAHLLDLGVVQLLIKAGADINKTSDFGSSHQGALAILINDILPGRPIPPDAVEIGEVLLRAGAKVHPDIVKRVLQTLHLPRLVYGLVTSVSDYDHLSLIRDGFLSMIAGYLDDWQATEATKKIIMACERTKCKRCLTDYQDKVDWALIQGAKQGKMQFVQLLLLYSRTPHRALSAAIRSGRREVIDCILSLEPDLNAPAHSIDEEEWNSESEEAYQSITTSLAEAISAGDERLIEKLEHSAAFKCLGEGGRFQPAIAAASKNCNMVYIQKLLDCCPSPTPSHLTSAVLYAVQNDHEESLLTLLRAGADVNFPRTGKSFYTLPPSPLFAAVLRRNSRMVRAILDADALGHPSIGWDLYEYKGRKTTLLGEALQWGDMSIIQDLQLTFCHHSALQRNELSDVLERGDMAVFEFVLKSRMAFRDALTKCIGIGLSRGDTELIRKLVESGADPTDSSMLTTCVEKHPEMLPLLLELATFRMNRYIKPEFFGVGALCAAIRRGSAGVEAFNLLLGSGLVDVSTGHSSACWPLVIAIETSRSGDHADFEVIKKLLDAGCDPDLVYTRVFGWMNNETPLLEAIKTKCKDLVELLISRGATVNREANFGVKRTPLQKAVEVDSLEIVTLLLKAGADVNLRPATRGGATAFQLAAIRGNCIIAAKLLDLGADLHASPAEVNGRWPLEGAAENGGIEMIGFLWKINNGDFDQKQCRRAMELAEGNGYLACRDAIAELSQARAASLPALGTY
ncbi:uncharacterized protein PAC_10905 [Phialocephala subalpina]|uniref:Clr5 domain-containing protein n=1 Tax=Phialocephala subalpina TaxID=576137 RepID=A0A1L7X7L4_9HELO|nr:uncharacterized protein PAC_10905 [Phialocephala subalpina]